MSKPKQNEITAGTELKRAIKEAIEIAGNQRAKAPVKGFAKYKKEKGN